MDKFLIVGLGNPGEKYQNTRHNIGFDIMDALAESKEVTFSTERYGEVASMKIKGRPVFLLKPSTFMNLSGKAVRYWQEKEKISMANTLVVVDDVALPLGMLRMKQKGSDGGHNGLANITEILSSGAYPRLRVGIGNDFPRGYQIEYVLGEWTSEDKEILKPKIEKSVKMCVSFVMIGATRTMNQFNETQKAKPKEPKSDNAENNKAEE